MVYTINLDGVVLSVNGIVPDVSGNVTITIPPSVNLYNTSDSLTGNRVINTGSNLFTISDVPVTQEPSALLELNSENRGFLPPRMAGANAESITLSGSSNGLMVYITDGDGFVINSTGWWGYDGADWKKFVTL